MKSVVFSHNDRVVEVLTDATVLSALLSERVPVMMACGGKGLCATCHVFVERGNNGLSPRTKREERTLALIADANQHSRLACQARVLTDGVVVKLPKGLYVERSADLNSLIGRRAESRLLHPINGRVLLDEGKIITRSIVQKLADVDVDMAKMLAASREV